MSGDMVTVTWPDGGKMALPYPKGPALQKAQRRWGALGAKGRRNVLRTLRLRHGLAMMTLDKMPLEIRALLVDFLQVD